MKSTFNNKSDAHGEALSGSKARRQARRITCPVCGSELRGGKKHREDGRECMRFQCEKCGKERIVAGQLMKIDGKWERIKE